MRPRSRIENRSAPSTRFGKNLDLRLSFSKFEFFTWPAALYLILKNDAEFALFQLLFDMFSKCIQVRTLIDSKVHFNFWMNCCLRIRNSGTKRPHDRTQHYLGPALAVAPLFDQPDTSHVGFCAGLIHSTSSRLTMSASVFATSPCRGLSLSR